ncbi:MAG: permease-like cell division protein FtsX [Paludibacteraceae bacterium]|nr:permease-like cell division protein FtsX [Paludibacteraceae bacterium]MBR1480978.1 permease-like cell division protein FtsX [Paludibacteraceae bacterium]
MSKGHRHHFFNMHITSAISVMLVLLLIGMECVLLLSAGNLMRRVRENVAMQVVLTEEADSVSLHNMEGMLQAVSYCHDYRYISPEEALEEHMRLLGEDPTRFLGYNPLSASYELHLNAEYANADSMAVIEQRLSSLPYVSRVVYQRDLLQLMNKNLNRVTWFLAGIALLLLIIAQALMVNTIRLQIYSKRFLIRTMTLVGATSWHIRRPFVRKNVGMGALAAVLAYIALLGGVYYLNVRMGVLLFPLTWQNLTLLAGVLLFFGVLITLLTAFIATGRYIRMKTDTLYEI